MNGSTVSLYMPDNFARFVLSFAIFSKSNFLHKRLSGLTAASMFNNGGSRGGSGGPLETRSNYFIFMGYFSKMRSNQQSEHLPLIHMNPISRNPGFAPV